MAFLNSWMLWGSLAAVGIAVPIIIHLLHRKHRQQTNWAAMELLRRALVTRSGQVRLENYLILFLRCLALLLIALSLLRPTINSSSGSWLGEKRIGMVIAIDASYSMNHGEKSRYEDAIALTKEILKTAEPGKPITVVLMSNHPQVLLRRSAYDPAGVEELLNKQKKASPYPLNLEQNLELLEELVAEMKAPVRECYLITDAQKSDWNQLSGNATASLSRLKKMSSVMVVPVQAENSKNLSLTDLSYSSGSLHESGVAHLIARVKNQGSSNTRPSRLKLYLDGVAVAERSVKALKPGQEKRFSFYTALDRAGDFSFRAELSVDELMEDNQRFAVVNVSERFRVLCVDDDSPERRSRRRSGTYYAGHALRLLGGAMDVTQVQSSELIRENLSRYHVILLANVADLGTDSVERIDQFVRRGGGVIFFPGSRVKPKFYNEQFRSVVFKVRAGSETGLDNQKIPDVLSIAFAKKDRPLSKDASVSVLEPGLRWEITTKSRRYRIEKEDQQLKITRPLLPGKLVELKVIGQNEKAWGIGPIQSNHSLARLTKELPSVVTEKAEFPAVVQVEPAPDSQTILSLAENEIPLLLSGNVGSGSVLMFTTAADRSWSEFPLHPLYVMLLQQTVTNVSSEIGSRNVTVGTLCRLSAPGRNVDDRVGVTNPQKEIRETKVTLSQQLQPICAFEPDKVGFYKVALAKETGTPEAVMAVNVDSSESGVPVLKKAELEGRLGSLNVAVAEQKELKGAIEKNRRGRELSTILLVLGIVIFILQSLLAKLFTNRMSDPETDITTTLEMSRVAAARRT